MDFKYSDSIIECLWPIEKDGSMDKNSLSIVLKYKKKDFSKSKNPLRFIKSNQTSKITHKKTFPFFFSIPHNNLSDKSKKYFFIIIISPNGNSR